MAVLQFMALVAWIAYGVYGKLGLLALDSAMGDRRIAPARTFRSRTMASHALELAAKFSNAIGSLARRRSKIATSTSGLIGQVALQS